MHNRITPKKLGGDQYFCPNFFQDRLNDDLASYHGDAQMSLRFNVKTFLFILKSCSSSKWSRNDWLCPDKLLKRKKRNGGFHITSQLIFLSNPVNSK